MRVTPVSAVPCAAAQLHDADVEVERANGAFVWSNGSEPAVGMSI